MTNVAVSLRVVDMPCAKIAPGQDRSEDAEGNDDRGEEECIGHRHDSLLCDYLGGTSWMSFDLDQERPGAFNRRGMRV